MFQDNYIDVNGIKIRYWDKGKGHPLVLVHGLGAATEYWEFVVADLAKNFRVIVLDMPGFGKSDKPDNTDYSLVYYATFLNDFFTAMNLQKTYLAAHSLGGALSLQFSVAHRAKVKKLFLFDSVGFSRQITWVFRLMSKRWICRMLLYKNRTMYEYALKLSMYATDNLSDEFIDRLYKTAKNPGHKNTIMQILNRHANVFGMKKSSVEPLLLKLKILKNLPIYVVWGEKDRILSIKHLKAGKKYLPHIQSQVLKNCGHVPMLEYPQKAAELMIDFFKN